MKRLGMLAILPALAAMSGCGVLWSDTAAPEPSASWAPARTHDPSELPRYPVATTGGATPIPHYSNCAAVRAAGAAPIRRGQPGYRSELDRDGDGIACDK